MKKRILSLVLSMVLLLIAAVPAFAWGYDPSNDELNSGVTAPGSSYSDASVANGYAYYVGASLLDDSDDWHVYLNEAFYDPSLSEDIYLDGTVSAGVKIWNASGWVDSSHQTALEALAAGMSFYSSVSNREDTYSFELNGNYWDGLYTVVLSCWHYELDCIVYRDNLQQSSQTLTSVPRLGGDFIFLDCP